MELTLAILIVPFFSALIIAPIKSKFSGVIATLSTLVVLSLWFINLLQNFDRPYKVIYEFTLFRWLDFNLPFVLLNDPLSSTLMILIIVIGFFVVFYSYGYMSPSNTDHPFKEPYGSYYFFLMLFIGAMVGVVCSGNLLQLFFFWEITTLCSWALISYTKERKAAFSGLKAFTMTHIGGFGFIIALAILYTEAKSFEFSAIGTLPQSLRFIVILLLFFAASAKSAQIPLFTWLPDAMVAPTPVSAYLHAAAMVKAGVYLIARLYIENPILEENFAILLGIVSISTMLLSVILYYLQKDLKKILAYSTIGHLGYIFLGISIGILGSDTAGGGGIFHIINHGFAKGLLFLTVGAIAYSIGSKDIRELSGISKKSPLLTVCFLVGMFAIVGIPPFSGFWSKFMIFAGAFSVGSPFTYTLGILAILESLLSFCWYIFVAHRVFFGSSSEKVSSSEIKVPMTMKLSLICLLVLTLLSPLIGYQFIVSLFGG